MTAREQAVDEGRCAEMLNNTKLRSSSEQEECLSHEKSVDLACQKTLSHLFSGEKNLSDFPFLDELSL